MDVRAELALYEEIAAIAEVIGSERMAELLMTMTGAELVPIPGRQVPGVAHDPDEANAARRVALRWLGNFGRIPHRFRYT